MTLGMAGLATIFAQGEGAGDAQAALGLAALLLAMLIYSASLVWLKRIGDDSPPLATTAGTLAVSLPLFGLVWWLAEGSVPAELPPRAGAAIVYLGVFGSVLGFALYYYVIRHMEAGRVALITLVTPVLALLLGQALNGEEITARVWFGSGLITGGLVLHQWTGLIGLARQAE
jgi:drug/metabolite transporter (DMT)-like permease